MVRVHTFLGLAAGTLLGVKSIDNLVIWMAEHREATREHVDLERKAVQLKRQLIRNMQEKEASQ